MKKWTYTALVAGLLALASSSPASAQEAVPAGERPPAGMCRIWIDGVPANRQPAPTDCATAMRKRPPNARIIFGEQRTEEPRQQPAQDRGREPRDTPQVRPPAQSPPQTPARSLRPPQRQGEPPAQIPRRRTPGD